MPQSDPEPSEDLSRQLSAMQRQLDEISSVLREQVSLQQARASQRWRPSLRLLLVVMGGLAVLAAWVGAELRHAKLQEEAIQVLVSHGARVQLVPSESLLAAIMPGSPAEPPAIVRRALGREFFNSLSQVSIQGGLQGKTDLAEVREALGKAPRIQGLRLRHVTLTTEDLNEVFQLSELESLDLSRTRLDENPIPEIANTQLRWFDGSHTRLGDQAAYDLASCRDLEYLNLERTMLTDEGLEYLKDIKSLKQLSLKRTRVSLPAIQKFAAARPDCFIEYQPLIFKSNGVLDMAAIMRGRKTFGTPTSSVLVNAQPPQGGGPYNSGGMF